MSKNRIITIVLKRDLQPSTTQYTIVRLENVGSVYLLNGSPRYKVGSTISHDDAEDLAAEYRDARVIFTI